MNNIEMIKSYLKKQGVPKSELDKHNTLVELMNFMRTIQ